MIKYFLIDKLNGRIVARGKSISYILRMAHFYDKFAVETVIKFEYTEEIPCGTKQAL
jgi:hypothetical protein